MKPFDRIKGLFSKAKGYVSRHSRVTRYIGFGLLALSNVAAITVATVAWFSLNTRESKIAMVSGDLDVEINMVTAYKYVYPYYKNSTEFIDYDSAGTVKKYILEDHVMKYNNTDIDDISITLDDATVVLGDKSGGTSNIYYTTDSASASSKKVCVPVTTSPAVYNPEFRYYLIGDDKFCGVDNSWSITDAYAFASKDDITGDKETSLDNVVIPVGSTFTLLETVPTGPEGSPFVYNYFEIDSVSESSAFKVIDSDGDQTGDSLLCLRSGIYKITYSNGQISIELHKGDNGTRKDISVITNNSLDPTKVTIDYAGGSVNKTDPDTEPYYEEIEDYLPVAIYDQNTALILDVEINFKNANPIEAGLQIERTDYDSHDTYINSIYSLAGRYADTENNLIGYVNDNQKNMMRASDFYNFYAVFTKTPFVATQNLTSTQVLWNNMHLMGNDQFQKFTNVEVDEHDNPVFDKTIACTLHPKDQNDSTIISGVDPDGNVENIYHCYITIEYDFEHNQYFLNKNRLGKTYLLDRDFGFRFFGTQHKEATA